MAPICLKHKPWPKAIAPTTTRPANKIYRRREQFFSLAAANGKIAVGVAARIGRAGAGAPGNSASSNQLRMLTMTTSYLRAAAITPLLTCFLLGSAVALELADLTNKQAAQGIKGALTQGAASAIGKLGAPGGFLDNPKVKIPLPPALDEFAKGMRMLGQGKEADELVATINKAAEQAVPEAKPLLINAVKSMTVEDGKKILTGGNDSVTQFFRSKTAAPLVAKFLPIVKRATDRVGLAQKYNQFAGQGTRLGLIKGDAANIEQYVTAKALDGLYLMIGEEERAIRQNPTAAGSAIVSKVFGALR
jgi:hypothetical protein